MKRGMFFVICKIYLVYNKNCTELDQLSVFIQTKVKPYFPLLLNNLNLGMYYLSNDANFVIFDSKLKKEWRSIIKDESKMAAGSPNCQKIIKK